MRHRGRVVRAIGYDVEGRGFESRLGSTGDWKTLSVNPVVNWYFL